MTLGPATDGRASPLRLEDVRTCQADWAEMILPHAAYFRGAISRIKGARLHVMAFAYAVGGIEESRSISDAFVPYPFARAAFGREPVDKAISACSRVLEKWGTGKWFPMDRLQPGVSEVLIAARTPQLNELSRDVLERAWRGTHRELRAVIVHVSRMLTKWGIISKPIVGAYETPRGVVIDTTGAPLACSAACRAGLARPSRVERIYSLVGRGYGLSCADRSV